MIASLTLLSAQTLNFSGMVWQVKDSGAERVGPGGNFFSSKLARVDEKGRLRLTIDKVGDNWACSEVIGSKPLGYGTYRWIIDKGLENLPPTAVLGLFTWSDKPEENHQEIDFEASFWGDTAAPNFQYVVQPYDVVGNIKRFSGVMLDKPQRIEFTWRPDRVDFVNFVWRDGSWKQHQSWSRKGKGVPQFSDAQPRINFWLFESKPPTARREVIVRSFSFQPLKAGKG